MRGAWLGCDNFGFGLSMRHVNLRQSLLRGCICAAESNKSGD
jgi:hypothetical protein